ncbi:unnamed protein product [Mycena citricolor]|uniref:Uncharacterized protein n=1 Tax=Mycena citricolor TaxID=2018698 RepID=A0AAD2Q0H8_9AGAR|nr:unnamed protein product [Mycena citricolor]
MLVSRSLVPSLDDPRHHSSELLRVVNSRKRDVRDVLAQERAQGTPTFSDMKLQKPVLRHDGPKMRVMGLVSCDAPLLREAFGGRGIRRHAEERTEDDRAEPDAPAGRRVLRISRRWRE